MKEIIKCRAEMDERGNSQLYIRGNAKSKVDLFVKTNKIEHLLRLTKENKRKIAKSRTKGYHY